MSISATPLRLGIKGDAVDPQEVARLNAILKSIENFSVAKLNTLGTVGAPSLSPDFDSDTGGWFPAANTMAFSAGAVEAFRFTSSLITMALPISTTALTLSAQNALTFTHATAEIQAGATSLSFMASNGTTANMVITEAGAVTIRSTLTLTNGTLVMGIANSGNANYDIKAATADADDDAGIRIGGGGAIDVSRGAYAEFFGNEVTTVGGKVRLYAGNSAQSQIEFYTSNATLALTLGSSQQATFAGAVSGITTLASGAHTITAATPLVLVNGQNVSVAVTSQTVGATTLTVPNFASVSDTFVFVTLAQELAGKTLNASVGKGTWTASGTWTLPAITLGGTVSGTPTWASNQAITLSTAAQPNITSVGTLTSLTLSGAVSFNLSAGGNFDIKASSLDTTYLRIGGGSDAGDPAKGAGITLYGNSFGSGLSGFALYRSGTTAGNLHRFSCNSVVEMEIAEVAATNGHTSLYLNRYATSGGAGFRQVQFVDPGAAGINLTAGQKVLILSS